MQSFIVTFRETFEAALITGIVLSYLNRTAQSRYNGTVYAGIIAAIAGSLIAAGIIDAVASDFTGFTEQVFEGIAMYVTVCFLVVMIMWCVRHKHRTPEIETMVSAQLDKGHRWGLFFLVFVAVLREGIEAVLFLHGISSAYGSMAPAMALLGILAAVAVGYGFFKGMVKINLKFFFNATTLLLILFAAGLLAHGTHELEEVGLIPPLIEQVWNINPPDSAHPFHEKGIIGSFMVALFGYNGNPSLVEVLSYAAFLTAAFGWWRSIERRHKLQIAGA